MTRSHNPIEVWADMESMMPATRDFGGTTPTDMSVRTLEVAHDHATGRYRLRRSGLAHDLSEAALDMMGDFLTRETERSRHERAGTNLRNHKEALWRGLRNSKEYGISQMAEDKVRPLFWAAFCDANYIGRELTREKYTRENAQAYVTRFKEDNAMSNADWKFFCKQNDNYLYQHFRSPPPYCFRWPKHLIECKTRYQTNRMMSLVPLMDWLREYFKTDEAHIAITRHGRYRDFEAWNTGGAPDAAIFDNLINDFIDLTAPNNSGQWAEPERVLRGVKTWHEFETKVRRTEAELGRGRNRYGRSPAMMAADMARGIDQQIMYAMGVDSMRNFVPQAGGIQSRRGMSYGEMRALYGNNPQNIERTEAERGLTIETLRQAREILERNNVPVDDGLTATEVMNRALAHLGTYGHAEMEINDQFLRSYQREMLRDFEINPWMLRGDGAPPTQLKKPEGDAIKKYEWLHPDLARTGEAFGGKFKFYLIEDNALLHKEGTGLEHCIWRLYQNKFIDGKYIAYHIDAPHIEKDGFTCGFSLKTPGGDRFELRPGAVNTMYMRHDRVVRVLTEDESREPIKQHEDKPKPKPQPEWAFDQCRGRKNSTPKDKELDAVSKMLLDQIRKHQPTERKEDDKKKA